VNENISYILLLGHSFWYTGLHLEEHWYQGSYQSGMSWDHNNLIWVSFWKVPTRGDTTLLQVLYQSQYQVYYILCRSYVPASYQPKISLGPHTRTRLVWKFFKVPNTSARPGMKNKTKEKPLTPGPAGIFKCAYQTNTRCYGNPKILDINSYFIFSCKTYWCFVFAV